MEGGGDNGFSGSSLSKFPKSLTFSLDSRSWYRPTPQFVPQNNFVWDQRLQNFEKNQGTLIKPSSAFGEFSFSSSLFQENGVPIIPSLAMDQSLGVDNMFLDGGHCTTLEQVRNYPNINFANDGPNTSRSYTKRLWTSKEDSKLYKLVEQFGTKNWAAVSDYMEGRAGKQCRERWYNNLRPDIKTDDWSEDEERILVEAHERMGKKWSKIVKLLPGRTENAIKNHWNAALRKKTTRIRCKRDELDIGSRRKSTILRDYLKGTSTNNNNNNNNNNVVSIPTSNDNVTIGNFTAIPPDELPSIDLIQSYDEECAFMENLFPMESQLQTNVNPERCNGNLECGSSSSSFPIDDNFDAYVSCLMGEPYKFF